jgi:hypothetical protein
MKKDLQIFRDNIEQLRKENKSYVEIAAKQELDRKQTLLGLKAYASLFFVNMVTNISLHDKEVRLAVDETKHSFEVELSKQMSAAASQLEKLKSENEIMAKQITTLTSG